MTEAPAGPDGRIDAPDRDSTLIVLTAATQALLIQPKRRAEMVLALAQAIETDVASRTVR